MEENGVWRTVGGRRIFIKEGQDLASAMKESGKFKSSIESKEKELSKEEKADKSVLIREQRDELREKLRKCGLSKDEYEDIKKQIKELTKQKEELDKDLSNLDLRDAKERLEEKSRIKVKENKTLKNGLSDEEIAKKYREENDKPLKEELERELYDIERYEDEYGIDDTVLNDVRTEIYAKMERLYDDGEISDYVWEDFVDDYNNKVNDIMSEKGYEGYMHQDKYYYSMLPKAKRAYDSILDELNKRGLDYKISRSWNPGELPSIYVENKDGDIFRIANHYNSKNQEFSSGSWERNIIYSTEDYINYKDTVFKDIEEWLKNNED